MRSTGSPSTKSIGEDGSSTPPDLAQISGLLSQPKRQHLGNLNLNQSYYTWSVHVYANPGGYILVSSSAGLGSSDFKRVDLPYDILPTLREQVDELRDEA